MTLLALLGACGRLEFDAHTDGGAAGPDARPCVAVGHDEDGDGIDDACDPCPHRAGDATDSDGDGVGDACDPSSMPLEDIAFFDPFLTQSSAWKFDTQEQFLPDALHFSAVGKAISGTLVAPPTNEVLEVNGQAGAAGTGDYAVSLQIGEANQPRHYFCDLTFFQGQQILSFVYTLDEVTYTPIQFLPVATNLGGNEFRLTLQHEPPMMTCTAVIGASMTTVGGAIPAGISPDEAIITAVNVDAIFTSFVRIATQ